MQLHIGIGTKIAPLGDLTGTYSSHLIVLRQVATKPPQGLDQRLVVDLCQLPGHREQDGAGGAGDTPVDPSAHKARGLEINDQVMLDYPNLT